MGEEKPLSIYISIVYPEHPDGAELFWSVETALFWGVDLQK